MGNCALKPKVLWEAGAPAPEELKDSLLEYQKIDATKSLSNLFLQDNAEKKTKEDEKMTPEKMPVTDDLKKTLAEGDYPIKDAISPAISLETETEAPGDEKITPEMMSITKDLKTALTEAKSPVTDTRSPVTETKALVDDQKVKNEEKVIDVVTVKETKTEEVGKEAAQ